MSKFYILPPRPLVGRRFADFLSSVFPGLTWDEVIWTDLAEALSAAASTHPDVFVVHREDLSDGEVAKSLIHAFGAELGDEVIEFAAAELVPTRWRIEAPIGTRRQAA